MVMKRSGEGSTGKITTSKGNQLKMRVGDTWYKADYLGYEGAAEVAASCLLSQSNISEYVSYKLNKMWYLEKEYNACTSPHFLDNEEEIITADRLMQREISPKYIDTMRSMTLKDRIEFFVNSIAKITGISDFGVCLTKKMEFDRLILNDDDHFNNIAFIRDAKGAYRAAPVFDNGGAFLSDTRECYPLEKNTIGLINEVSAKPFDKNFDKQTEMLISLYGSQLCLYKDAQITPEIKQEITTQYGQVITDRISKVLDHSMYLYPEYFCLDRELEQYKKKRECKINRYIDKQNANREETRKKTHIVKKNKDNELQ